VGVIEGIILELSVMSSSFIAVIGTTGTIREINEGDAASLGGEGSIEVWATGDEVVEEEKMGVEQADIILE